MLSSSDSARSKPDIMTARRALPSPFLLALAFACLATLVCAALALAAAAPASSRAALPSTRAIYRVRASRDRDFRPLLGLGVDVAGSGPNGSLDVILTPAERDQVRALGYDPEPIPLGSSGSGAALSPTLNPNLGAYHTVAEAHAEMVSYVAAHPAIAFLDTLGFSVEGRAIEAVKISDNVATQESEPEMLIVGCHHARELMSVEIPLYVMRRLLDGYGTDPILTNLVNTRQIWIVPIVNPDGHVYVENNANGQSDNWWRKNRRPNADGSFGVDLNRNYSYQWGYDDVGSSPTPSSDIYRGTGPFSEPEVAAIRDFMAAHAFSVSASFHSYGDLVLYPWGYAPQDTPDNAIFAALGDSLALQNGYLAGNPKSGAIYVTNGEMNDWLYGDTTTKPRAYGFTFEVNTSDQGGFDPPDALIGPTCDLNWGPVLTLLRYADAPSRILPPPRPAAPTYTVVTGGKLQVSWTYPQPDPANAPVRHDVRQIASVTSGVDDAESGFGAWDSVLFSWSTTRHASGTHSFWSGSGNNRTSILTSKAGMDVVAAESLTVNAFWDLESDRDYWYLEGSADGGATWTALPGSATTNYNPFGNNQGNGVTGNSGGVFRQASFMLGTFAGKQILVRFRCVTDPATAGEGLYVDDVSPTVFQSGVTDTDTQSASNSYLVVPVPSAPTWFQVRAHDAEGQTGIWSTRSRFDPTVSAVASPPVPALVDRLERNEPNPFNPETEIAFEIGVGKPGPFRMDVFDLAGRHVATLIQGWDNGAGERRTARWDGRSDAGNSVASGVYVVSLQTIRGRLARKVSLLR